MKKPVSAEIKAAEAQRKAELSERLDREAQIESERIRGQFDAERKRLARRYGATVQLTSDVNN